MANPSRSSAGRSSSAVDSPRAPLATFQTSLPSIRQLHPYLPPSGGMSQHSQHGESSHIAHPSYHPSAAPQFESNVYEHAIDSENEDADTQGPPKKKRRRQALSCTECKRRKIKCDRNQPCAPCTRRGEQAKCQWHVVEPVRLMPRSAPSPSSSSEKYVSRAEYDELKMRFDHLENTVHRFIAANSGLISETSSFGSATSGHLSSESGSVGAPAAVGSAQHVTGTPVAGPDYPVPSTGYGIAGTIGNEPVPATRSPSPSSQNIPTTSRFNLPTHHSSTSSHLVPSRKYSIPQQSNTTSTYEFEPATHHQQVQQGLLGSSSTPQFSSRRPQTHARQSSRSSVGSAGSHGSMRSPMIPQGSGGTPKANSPTLQSRVPPNESPSMTVSSPSLIKKSPLSLASITSPFDSEPGLSSRAGALPSEVLKSVHPISTQRRLTVSPTSNQSKNFCAQTLRLGERLRYPTLSTPIRHKPCTILPHSPLSLLILHILTTHLFIHHFLLAQHRVIAALSAVRSIQLTETLVPQGRIEESLAIFHHLRSPYRQPIFHYFMLNLPKRENPESLRAWSSTQHCQEFIPYLLPHQ
ncbi:hypothetical protein C8J55DRAFT_300889 [Lentinula edodes]|uniref:Oleate activated transcription factor 3 n=1 Tax=Lentinula lateritia TaxID=40482 RepID=A0A9W9DWK7_9AGAR|nr:hypothetical protein C8J55DRAFT_300889 [Lentinula edodes]